MRIVVLVKEVPDTYGDRHLDLETGLTRRADAERVIDEISERALEVALVHADSNPGTEVVLLSMGPEEATASLRKALASGAASATHVVDPELIGADALLTAEVLAAALRRGGFDLVLAGSASTDGTGGVVPSALAEYLEVPTLSGLSSVTIADGTVSGTRPVDGGTQAVRATLPAVVSVTEALPDARMANFKGIVAAKKKPIEVLSLSELGVAVDPATQARSILVSASERPPRAVGLKITDEGDAGTQLAEFLVSNRLA